jgi:hypothetical protein
MQDDNLSVIDSRLAALEYRVRWYRRLTFALGLGLLLGVSLAARTVPSVADVLQTRRLEVVDEAGKVGVAVYATAVGGRIEVLNNAGRQVFSAGAVQGDKEPVGLWEQTLRTIDRQGRELDQQRRMLEDLGRQLHNLLQARQTTGDHAPQSSGNAPQSYDITQLRFDVEQQRRAIEAVDRQLQSLTYQLRSLERR